VDQYDNHIYMTNHGQSGLFGLEPNYGCCTANFNQAFPKFAMSAYGKNGHTILSAALIPSELKTRIGNARVKITLKTDYPFKGLLDYWIETDRPVSFTFAIRIPSWAGQTSVETPDGEREARAGKIFKMASRFEGETRIRVRMSLPIRVLRSSRNLYHVERGALTFALPIEEQWIKHEYTRDGVDRIYPYCDYSVFPTSDWNVAFLDDPEKISEAEIKENGPTAVPFSHQAPPVQIGVRMVHIPWGTAPGQPFLCAPYPTDTNPISSPEIRWLVPYGCARLRMTDMPFAKDTKDEQS
ncbi:MAG: glycoside hydrolase family 127 protein, partial [Clostridia bacterium]|nr:glycoside hydrolase family 127 protein [Clostridia bacterium]